MHGHDSDDSDEMEDPQPRSAIKSKTFGLQASPIAEESESQLSTNREQRDYYDLRDLEDVGHPPKRPEVVKQLLQEQMKVEDFLDS